MCQKRNIVNLCMIMNFLNAMLYSMCIFIWHVAVKTWLNQLGQSVQMSVWWMQWSGRNRDLSNLEGGGEGGLTTAGMN